MPDLSPFSFFQLNVPLLLYEILPLARSPLKYRNDRPAKYVDGLCTGANACPRGLQAVAVEELPAILVSSVFTVFEASSRKRVTLFSFAHPLRLSATKTVHKPTRSRKEYAVPVISSTALTATQCSRPAPIVHSLPRNGSGNN